MLQVLGRASSINVRKVLWTCAELGLERELVEWGTPALPLDSPAFRALNPGALVPVLRDGDLVRKSPQFQQPELVAQSVVAWNRHMALLDRALAEGGP
jgi:glutathione S-transferase